MHPILSSKKRLIAYLAAWAAGGALLAGLVRLVGALTWLEAAELAFPLAFIYAFVCLTPWYTCRYLPLTGTGVVRILVNHLGAAILATAVWIAAARLLANLLFGVDPGITGRVGPLAPLLISVGLSLYGLS